MLHNQNHVQSTSAASSHPTQKSLYAPDGLDAEELLGHLPEPRFAMNSSAQARDNSVTRGRTTTVNTSQYELPPAPSSRNASAQPAGSEQNTASRGAAVGAIDTGLQRRLSNKYGHHRQTSVIHGVQHSRNTSFASPISNPSPLGSESLHNLSASARNGVNVRRVPQAAPELSSAFTSPVAQSQLHTQNPSIDSFVDGSSLPQDGGNSLARPRNATSRTRTGHGYSTSAAQHSTQPRTPGEYALHHLFHAFVLRADQKITQCLANIDTLVTPVEQICGPGADSSFDQLVSSLGHISRQNPKPLVDSLMLWRKAKGDEAAALKKQISLHRFQATFPRRNYEPVSAGGAPALSDSHNDTVPLPVPESLQHDYAQADRRATVSVYVLCRVLIAVFEQSSLEAITPELAYKLEDIVFGQLKEVDPAQLVKSSLRLANWRIYGQVLGYMSRLDFDAVTLRYTRQVDTWQRDVAKSTSTIAARDLEARVELLLLAMRHLHIPISQDAATQVCEVLNTLGSLFVEAHGPRIKQAYCQLFERLLLPVAGNPEHFQKLPRWKPFIDTVNSRLGNMLSKVRHWSTGFPLSILLYCILPLETFASQWQTTISSLAPKLKDKTTRASAIQAICQLTWTYLARVGDPAPTRLRKIDEVIRQTFPPGRKTHVVTDPGVAEALIQLIRMIGFAYQDLCFKTIVFPLVHADMFQSSKDLKIEQMDPEKMVIGIRGFLAIMADLENQNDTRPPFPSFSLIKQPPSDHLPTSPSVIKPEILHEVVSKTLPHEQPVSATPVNVSALSESTKQHYFQFCEILGRITILCDNTFGGQASLNEKFSALAPKTPLVDAFTLVRKEESSLLDHKQAYFELLHVAIQALPRCLTDYIPLNTLINLLCTGSAHVEPNVASSASESLKAISRQGHAQAVAIAFPRFIFKYDLQYSTMSDEGRLGPAHIEATLTLYLELLQIWMEQLRPKAKASTTDTQEKTTLGTARATKMELVNVIPQVDEVEAYGLFFLCSQSRRVRSFAIKVFQMVVQFDQTLGQDEPARVIKILVNNWSEILTLQNDLLSVAERSRLQKDRRKVDAQNTLIEICSSEVSYDATLWYKAFPNLIRHIFEQCPNAIALCRGIVCDRLMVMQTDVEAFSKLSAGSSAVSDFRPPGRSAATPGDVLFDQWKLYLIMACVTLNSPGAQSQSQLANAAHSRKTSKPAGPQHDKMGSARALFAAIIPMLGAGPEAIRQAIVVALGSVNRKLYRTLLESLQYAVVKCNDDAKARISHQRTPSSPQRSQETERLRIEVTHVYKLTASFLRHRDTWEEEWIMNNLSTYTRELRIYLSDTDIQNDWRFQRLRYHFCGLVEEFFEGTNRTSTPARWLPFEARKSTFTLMEDWCGYSAEQHSLLRRRESTEGAAVFMAGRDFGERSNANAAMEKEKNNLRMAALSAMAALCAGPVSIKNEANMVLSFNLPRMLSWIDTIFATSNDKMHIIGRRALKSLLLNNPGHLVIMEHAIECCYRLEQQKSVESYFGVVADVLIQDANYPLDFWKVLGAVIFTLGSEHREIRMLSARLLRTLDDRQEKGSNLQDFDISISDKTRAVYKLAQFEYSRRLAQAHPDLAFKIFSEFSLHYKNSKTDHQRNIVAAILPWLQTLELQVDPNTASPTAVSYMLLVNMFEITVSSCNVLHNEVQALWQALAAGPHAGNVQLILDFIIHLCLERREQNFVEYAKQIIVYLSATLAGSRVLEFFVLQLTPKNMVNDKKGMEQVIPDTSQLPYVADLNTILPIGNKQAGLSLGQVALIFLVDLMVPPVKLIKDDTVKLIHVVLILWDHYTPTVQEQAREMLVHLIHGLVTTKIENESIKPIKQRIETLVDEIRKNDEHISWSYENHTGGIEDDGETRVPTALSHLAREIVTIFDLALDSFSDSWAKEALRWASVCPVRHLACRSFQIFRCVSATLDARMIADMLARLSNTIADEHTDYQTFSMEILTTLKIVIGGMDSKMLLRYPQLFWATCACLNTIHEREFFETLGMLEKLMDALDLSDAHIHDTLLKARPSKWEGGFEGLQPLLYKGLKSADSVDRTLLLLQRMATIADCELIGAQDRLLFNVLANLPRMLHDFDLEQPTAIVISCAQQLAEVAKDHGHDLLCVALSRFAGRRFASSKDALKEMIIGIEAAYFSRQDSQSLIFMMGLLTNKVPWFRIKVMDILCELIPLVDMKDSAITSHGPDLISPLLRLLQTEHCTQALEVMDFIMEVSGNPLEKHHIRMSMASGAARAIRKEYERTKSLYGIPNTSGWSIPMPAVFSSMTRNNVHAVFFTFGDSEMMKEQDSRTPDVEFHQDDGYGDSYFPTKDRAGISESNETSIDTNVSDLVNTLDALDDFFNDASDQEEAITPTGNSRSSYTGPELHENNAHLYDEQTAPILHRSLARTSSTLSFQNGLAETSLSSAAQHKTNPSISSNNYTSIQNSFSSIDEVSGPGPSLPSSTKKSTPMPNLAATPLSRPGLHARSITSPANQFPVSQPTASQTLPSLPQGLAFQAEDNNPYYDDAVLSDVENSPFPALITTLSNGAKPSTMATTQPTHQVTPTSATETPSAFSIQGMRRGMRRLTGGKSESLREKEKVRDAARLRALSINQNQGGVVKESPKVPRVPLEYLTASTVNTSERSPATSPGL